MIHYDHLYRARQWKNANLASLQVAEELITEQDITAQAQRLKPGLAKYARQNRIVNKFEPPLYLLMRLVIVSLFLCVLCSSLLPSAIPPLVMKIGCVIATVYSIFTMWGGQVEAQLKSLTDAMAPLNPITGTNACLDAAKYVQSADAAILEWRDYAIAERGQLYSFDVEVMRCLYEMTRAEQRSAALLKMPQGPSHEEKLAQACREAHGIAVV